MSEQKLPVVPKFRVWLPDPDVERMLKVKALVFEHDKTRCVCGYAFDFYLEDEDATIMQSTGLLDKNGKEIFDGDIVKRYRSPFFKAEWEYQIETVVKREACLLLEKKFGRNSATMSFGSPFAKSDLLEVVGNIYENPDLLEVGQ